MTKYVNIASLRKPPVLIIEDEDGVKHEMKAATLDAFIESLKEVEELGLQASPVQEAELLAKTILRFFPTLTREQVGSWDIAMLKELYEMVLINSGAAASTDEKDVEEMKKTGKSAPAA